MHRPQAWSRMRPRKAQPSHSAAQRARERHGDPARDASGTNTFRVRVLCRWCVLDARVTGDAS